MLKKLVQAVDPQKKGQPKINKKTNKSTKNLNKFPLRLHNQQRILPNKHLSLQTLIRNLIWRVNKLLKEQAQLCK